MVARPTDEARRKAAVGALLSMTADVVVGRYFPEQLAPRKRHLAEVAAEVKDDPRFGSLAYAALNWCEASQGIAAAHAMVNLRTEIGSYFARSAVDRFSAWQASAGIDPAQSRKTA